MINLFVTAAISQAPYAPAVPPIPDYSRTTDTEFCEMAQGTASRLPRMLDDITMLNTVTASCSERTVVFGRVVSTRMSNLPLGWLNDAPAIWNRTTCVDRWAPYRFMAQRGWRIVTTWNFLGGASISHTLAC